MWHPTCETTWQNAADFSSKLREDFDRDHPDSSQETTTSNSTIIEGLKEKGDVELLPPETLSKLCDGLVGIYLEYQFECKRNTSKCCKVGGQITNHICRRNSTRTAELEGVHKIKVEWDDGDTEICSPKRIFFYLGLGPVNQR